MNPMLDVGRGPAGLKLRDQAATTSVAYMIDPRFPGGTSSAVAQELRAVAELDLAVTVHAVSSSMFSDRAVAPVLERAFRDLGLTPIWDAPVISADRVIIHNPAFLKFDKRFDAKILARHLLVVTHENFLRPGGQESFDIASCLGLIDRNALVLAKTLAPISAYNRQTVRDWLARRPEQAHWSLLDQDWFNICDFDLVPPTSRPRDRRGRHSRPGYEKFPALTDLDLCFPKSAESNLLLGADGFLAEGKKRPHWRIAAFGDMPVPEFFENIDFYVYFTSPAWRESFGRGLAEAIAAGKLVISDAATASVFAGGVVSVTPAEVSQTIQYYLGHPHAYREQVLKAQTALGRFSTTRFRMLFSTIAEDGDRSEAA